MIICFDGLLSMYSDNPLITWSCKIMWQTKVIISSLSKCLWQGGNLPWWAAVRKVTSSFNYVVLCYKLKIIISPLQYIYGHKPRQAGDLPSEASTYNVAPTFGNMALRDHVTNWKHMLTSRMRMATKRDRMMTPWLYNHVVFKISWHSKIILCPLIECLWPLMLAG